jgi:AraC-like DNA-binding protein
MVSDRPIYPPGGGIALKSATGEKYPLMIPIPVPQAAIARSSAMSVAYLPPYAALPAEFLEADAAVVAWDDRLARVSVSGRECRAPDFTERIVLVPHRQWERPIRDLDAVDPFLFRMAQALRCGFRRGLSPPEIYLEGLEPSLSAHLERFYARPTRQRDKAGLSEGRMAKALAFIESHLTEAMPLGELAEAANLSLFHFGRMFKRSMGMSPAAYMVRRRIDVAEELLAQTSLSIAEVSARVGFRTQAHFCTAFRRVRSITPSRSRRNARSAARAVRT